MWNGDLNMPRAKTINQVIMGMTDVQVKITINIYH